MSTDKKTLLLVDGSSYLYRAFFAGGDAMSVTLPDGTVQKTGAIRIMINMLAKLRKDVCSDYVVCVFDAKGPTFRIKHAHGVVAAHILAQLLHHVDHAANGACGGAGAIA